MFRRRSKSRLLIMLVLFAFLTTTLTGCGAGMMTLLKIAGVSTLLPSKWTSSGGIVRIIAEIITGDMLTEVVARVTHPSTSIITEVILTRNAEGKYEGAFQAPENDSQTTPETYEAVVTATDSSGNTATSEPVEVEVPPAEREVTSDQ